MRINTQAYTKVLILFFVQKKTLRKTIKAIIKKTISWVNPISTEWNYHSFQKKND